LHKTANNGDEESVVRNVQLMLRVVVSAAPVRPSNPPRSAKKAQTRSVRIAVRRRAVGQLKGGRCYG